MAKHGAGLRITVTVAEAAAYLSGLIDGEGSVESGERGRGRCVRIFNTEPALIEAACDCLALLGVAFSASWRTTTGQKIGTVSVYGRGNLARLAVTLELRHPEKQRRLAEAVGSYRPSPPIAEMVALRRRGLTMREIAARVGYASKSTVEYHLRACGLI